METVLSAIREAKQTGDKWVTVEIPRDVPFKFFVEYLRADGYTVQRDSPNYVKISWK